MKLHTLTLTLAVLAFSAQAADKAPVAAAPVVAATPAAAAAAAAPRSPEEWLGRMTDFTKNASAFRDPKVFMPWANTVTDPGVYVAMMNSAQDPSAWLNMMNSATSPEALRNYMQFSDPALAMRWMNAGMDPAFYTAFMTQFTDPAKMMRWVMMPMDPKMWGAMMNMANPNMYMKWAMAPMDPRAWGTMGNMMNPATYLGFMGTGMDPKTYGTWGNWFNYAPQAPANFDANAMTNMFGGMLPSIQAPAAVAPAAQPAAAPAPAAAKPAVVAAAAPAAPVAKAAPTTLTLSGDALFKLNKSSIRDLSKEGKTKLDETVAKIKTMGEIGQIKVVGHADPTGKKATNLKLSQARAKSVKSYLVSQGVKSDVIISSGVGDSQPVVQCDAGLAKDKLRDCHAPNRRVEIEITAKGK